MGGYAAYVWPVFAVALLLVIGVAVSPRLRHKRLIEKFRIEQEVSRED